jgi:hypothetical protein
MQRGDLVELSEVAKVSVNLDPHIYQLGIVLNSVSFPVMTGIQDNTQKCYEVFLKNGSVEVFYEEDLEVV